KRTAGSRPAVLNQKGGQYETTSTVAPALRQKQIEPTVLNHERRWGMLISEMYPHKYFKAEDFKNGRRLTLTVAEVVQDIVNGEDGESEEKWVLRFEEEGPALVLNITNARTLEELSGSSDSDDWQGLRITLFSTKVQFGTKKVDGIRIDPADADELPGVAHGKN